MAVSGEILFFSDCPSLQTLCSVQLQVPKPNGINMAMSTYQPQLIKAREFIFTEPEIIATPLLNTDRKMQIIMQQTMFRSGRLQARCERLGVAVSEPTRVIPSDFQGCLNYALLARLAPLWNKAGDYMVQGRDFITNNQKMYAVKMDLKVNENELFLALRAYQVRLPPITVNDLEISPPVLADFMAERPHAVIYEYSIRHKWIYILPSLKRGVVVSVHHRIPSDSPFKSYKDMKRYWKNTYGYRIPESDEGMLYYQVYFKPIGNTLFTYPECCIRAHDMTVLPRADTQAITVAFLADLHTKLPNVCGGRVNFSPRGMQHTAYLSEATQITTKGPGPNLQANEAEKQRFRPSQPSSMQSTWKPSASSYTSSYSKNSGNNKSGSSQPQPSQTSNSVKAKVVDSNREIGVVGSSSQLQQEIRNGSDGIGASDSSIITGHTQNSKISDLTQMSVVVDGQKDKLPPNSMKNTNNNQVQTSTSKNTSGKIRPIFLPKSKIQNLAAKKIPSFKPVAKPGSFTKKSFNQSLNLNSSFNSDSNTTPKTKPTFKPRPVFPTSNAVSKPAQKPRLSLPNMALSSLLQHKESGALQFSTKTQESRLSGGESGYESMPAPSPARPMFSAATPKQALPQTPILANPGKRKQLGDADTPTAKKARAKPKIQETVDIAALAASHQLGKVNTATLMNWLKERKVVCKSKDKKADLVARVCAHLGLPEA